MARGGRGRWSPVVVVAVLALTAGGLALGRAAPAAGLGSPVRVSRLASPAVPAGAVATAPPAPSQTMSVDVVLPSSDPAGLQAELAGLYQQGSPDYHQWLTPSSFDRRFGPSPVLEQQVRTWLAGSGLRTGAVVGFAVKASGTRRAVAGALGVSFRGYRLRSGRAVVSSDGAPLVPSGLAGQVRGILGLDDLVAVDAQAIAGPAFRPVASGPTTRSAGSAVASVAAEPHVDGVTPCASLASTAAANGADTADQVGAAYGLGPVIAAGQTGAGQTVAVIEVATHSAADVSGYEHCLGLTNPVTTVAVDGGGGTKDLDEADLDIEQVATQAPGAAIESYEGQNSGLGLYDLWAQIVVQDSADVVSSSLGLCESDTGTVVPLLEDGLFEEAAAQGQAILAASGDSGSEDCFPGTGTGTGAGSTELDVDYPSSSEWVTAVGGTTLATGAAQTVWNDCQGATSSSCATGTALVGAGGGGVSRDEDAPPWASSPYQWSVATNPCGTSCRNVPDVSANAGTYEVFEVAGTWAELKGTSVAAPMVAGFVADIDSGCATTRQGDVAAQLYALAADRTYGTAFTDITAGDNDFTDTYGGKQFPASTGYDPASGIGTPLVTGWSCPEIDALSPASGKGGTTVKVSGLGLEAAQFSFGGVRARVLSATATSAVVAAPAGVHGVVGVSASDPMGTGTTAASFAFPAAPTPPPTPVSTPTPTPTAPAASPSTGYWEVASDGGIFSFDAPFRGSTGGTGSAAPVVGMADDLATGGYWEVASNGQVYAFDAPYLGSMGGEPLAEPIVGMAADPATGGYWLVAADGGIFAFDAPFHGSTGGVRLDKPIVGMAADPATSGYWLVAADGGIFAFDAPFAGSVGGTPLARPVVGMAGAL
ncbi:MAG TPA: S53 family peptidase [Acidimicrobiales bacterium]|nr:S53 family peptidase [Acidimicrobiales bacterium]